MPAPSRSWQRLTQAAEGGSWLREHSPTLLRAVLLQSADQSACTRQYSLRAFYKFLHCSQHGDVSRYTKSICILTNCELFVITPHRLINMAPWDGIKRAQRKTTGRAIAKANQGTDAGFKKASQAILTAFKGSTCGCHVLLPLVRVSLYHVQPHPCSDCRWCRFLVASCCCVPG